MVMQMIHPASPWENRAPRLFVGVSIADPFLRGGLLAQCTTFLLPLRDAGLTTGIKRSYTTQLEE